MSQKVGEILSRERRRLGKTQEQVAESMGVSQPAVSKLEKSDMEMGLDTLVAYCRAIRIKAASVLEELNK